MELFLMDPCVAIYLSHAYDVSYTYSLLTIHRTLKFQNLLSRISTGVLQGSPCSSTAFAGSKG